MIRSPGPWKVGARAHMNTLYAVFDAKGDLVVNLGDGGNGIAKQRGNAFAIAAVMDLLKAAQEAQEVLSVVAMTGRCSQGGEQRGNLEHAEVALGKLEAAIKKATEETEIEGNDRKPGSDPETLVAVVCENGKIYADGGGLAVFRKVNGEEMPPMEMAMEVRESIRSGGGMCDCDDHKIIQYVPNV